MSKIKINKGVNYVSYMRSESMLEELEAAETLQGDFVLHKDYCIENEMIEFHLSFSNSHLDGCICIGNLELLDHFDLSEWKNINYKHDKNNIPYVEIY